MEPLEATVGGDSLGILYPPGLEDTHVVAGWVVEGSGVHRVAPHVPSTLPLYRISPIIRHAPAFGVKPREVVRRELHLIGGTS